jgi:hypothetical protein
MIGPGRFAERAIQTILDFCLGAATTLVAVEKAGRRRCGVLMVNGSSARSIFMIKRTNIADERALGGGVIGSAI